MEQALGARTTAGLGRCGGRGRRLRMRGGHVAGTVAPDAGAASQHGPTGGLLPNPRPCLARKVNGFSHARPPRFQTPHPIAHMPLRHRACPSPATLRPGRTARPPGQSALDAHHQRRTPTGEVLWQTLHGRLRLLRPPPRCERFHNPGAPRASEGRRPRSDEGGQTRALYATRHPPGLRRGRTRLPRRLRRCADAHQHRPGLTALGNVIGGGLPGGALIETARMAVYGRSTGESFCEADRPLGEMRQMNLLTS